MNSPPSASLSSRSALIPAAADRPGDDPIFALNAEAMRRRKAGESILNATLGALMEDDGRLATMPVVREALDAVDTLRASSYAPIAGEPAFLQAVLHDVFGDGPRAREAVAAATPGGTGAPLAPDHTRALPLPVPAALLPMRKPAITSPTPSPSTSPAGRTQWPRPSPALPPPLNVWITPWA